jgi:hypothetical protein
MRGAKISDGLYAEGHLFGEKRWGGKSRPRTVESDGRDAYAWEGTAERRVRLRRYCLVREQAA